MKKICCIITLLFCSTLLTTSAQEKLLQLPSAMQESVSIQEEAVHDDLVYHGEVHEFHDLVYRGEEITIIKLSENEYK